MSEPTRRSDRWWGARVAIGIGLCSFFAVGVHQIMVAHDQDPHEVDACGNLAATLDWPPAEVAQAVWSQAQYARPGPIRTAAWRLWQGYESDDAPQWQQLLRGVSQACGEAGYGDPIPAEMPIPSTTI
jgi:hypothetical protein